MATFDSLAVSSTGALVVPFATLPKHSFLDSPFRAVKVEIRGGIREHVHEYGRLPGGTTEPLGRKLYEFDYEALFLTNDKEFPDAWPGTSNLLRNAFEQQLAGDLVVSTIGTVRARAITWTITQSNRMMNGETVRMLFREEAQTENLSPTAVAVLTKDSLPSQAQKLQDLCLEVGFESDFISDILDYANQIQTLISLQKRQLDILAVRATALGDMIRSFDELEKELNQPKNWRIVGALHDLCLTADRIARDALSKFAPLIEWPVPTEMSVVEVSIAIYGDVSRAMEIMRLNALPDPLKIRQGTILDVYADLSVGGLLRAA